MCKGVSILYDLQFRMYNNISNAQEYIKAVNNVIEIIIIIKITIQRTETVKESTKLNRTQKKEEQNKIILRGMWGVVGSLAENPVSWIFIFIFTVAKRKEN